MQLPARTEKPQNVAPFLDERMKQMLRDSRFNTDFPPVITDTTRQRCLELRRQFDEYLLPAEDSWILGRVAGVLSHYYVSKTPAQLQEIVAGDWVRVLSKYPAWAADQALSDYVEDEPSKRPTPAAIGKRCFELSQTVRENRERLNFCITKGVREGQELMREKTDAEKAEASKVVAETIAKLRAG